MFFQQKIRKYFGRRLGLPEIPFTLERLSSVGFHPKQIFDVGAYQGDFAKSCLSQWPKTKVACFEALEHKVTQLKHFASHNPSISVFPILVGAQACENVRLHESETASSILVEQLPQNFPVKFYPMRTVDQICQEHFEGHSPDFLKLDVQGYELEVLKGAEKSLPQMQAILAEVNLLDIHQNVPLLSEIIAWLDRRGWVAYDICGLTRRPLDRALWQADLLFVPRDSPLRSDKRWAA
ncbi:MAG: FkbM family methyltransferase [Rhizonema sp. PD38]|nr:FkbM family methyltransferase [Rhizonema sp. PD38]